VFRSGDETLLFSEIACFFLYQLQVTYGWLNVVPNKINTYGKKIKLKIKKIA